MSRSELWGKLSAYLDDELPWDERCKLQAYLATDAKAQEELDLMEAISHSLRELPDVPLPADFSASLHQKLVEAQAPPGAAPPKRFYNKRWFKGVAACAAVVVFVVAAGSIGSLMNAGMGTDALSGNAVMEEMSVADTAVTPEAADMTMAVATEAGAVDSAASAGKARSGDSLVGLQASSVSDSRIIRNADLSMEVVDFDGFYDQLNEIATQYDGYVLSSNISNDQGGNITSGSITLRVKAASLENALNAIQALGTVLSRNIYGEDITTEYLDVEARLAQYKEQRTRLQALYNQTNAVSDLIEIESELSRVQAEIDSLTGQLQYWQEITDLSTINLYCTLPAIYDQQVSLTGWDNLGQRLQAGLIAGVNLFLSGLANLVVGIVYILPLLIIIAALILIYIFVRKRQSLRK